LPQICRVCRQYTSAKFNLTDDEPSWIVVCLGCQSGRYACIAESSAKASYGLTDEECVSLPHKFRHLGYSGRYSSYSKELLLSSVKAIRNGHRTDAVRRLLPLYRGDPQAVSAAFVEAWKSSPISRDLATDAAALTSSGRPTSNQLHAFVAFHQGLLSFQPAFARVLATDTMKPHAELAKRMADSSRSQHSREAWRTSISRGQATMDAFVEAVKAEALRQATETARREEVWRIQREVQAERNRQSAEQQRERNNLQEEARQAHAAALAMNPAAVYTPPDLSRIPRVGLPRWHRCF
jgi:hypothetical protein